MRHHDCDAAVGFQICERFQTSGRRIVDNFFVCLRFQYRFDVDTEEAFDFQGSYVVKVYALPLPLIDEPSREIIATMPHDPGMLYL